MWTTLWWAIKHHTVSRMDWQETLSLMLQGAFFMIQGINSMSPNITEEYTSFSWYKMNVLHFSGIQVISHTSAAWHYNTKVNNINTFFTETPNTSHIHNHDCILLWNGNTEDLPNPKVVHGCLWGTDELQMNVNGFTRHLQILLSAGTMPESNFFSLCIIPKWQFMSIIRVIQIKLV
jgi:hypothetical protein